MKHYICSVTLDFDAFDEEEALDEFMNYLSDVRRSEVEVEVRPDKESWAQWLAHREEAADEG